MSTKYLPSGVYCAVLLSVLGCSEGPRDELSDNEPVAQSVAPLVDQRLGLAGFEPHLAVDPTNLLNVAVAQFNTISLSTDGGATFPTTLTIAAPAGWNFNRGGDPVLAYDSQGNLFFAFLATEATSNNMDVFVQRVNHAAGTFNGTPVNVSVQAGVGAATAPNANDKEWLAIDRFPGSPFQDRMYMTWTNLLPTGWVVVTSFSTNQGVTWQAAQTVSLNAEGNTWPPHIAAAPNGDVYVAYHGPTNGEIVMLRSPFDSPTSSGGTFDLTTRTSVFPPGAANLTDNVQSATPVLDRNQSWTLGSRQPFILPDPTNATRVLVVANDDPTDANNGAGFDDAGVFMVTSNNRGATWTAPGQIDADPATSHQLFPMAAFDFNTQCVSVAYYDSRNGAVNAAGNLLLDLFVRTSADSGANWGPEVQINDLPFDPDMLAQDRFPPSQTFRIGEYNGLAMARGIAWTGNDPADPAGNQNQQIIFDYSDGIAPTFTFVPPAITITDCSAPSLGTPTAQDDVCGIGGVTITNDAPAVFPLGTTIVTWTATDRAGNSVTATQTVTAELGDDASCCPAGTNVIVGTAGGDFILGTSGADCILGLGGNDDIFGRDGNDFIFGGEGRDDIDGDDGADFVSGGNGDDSLEGDSGNDTLIGGNGNDDLDAEGGNDICEGGPGDDHLDGDSGNDVLRGGDGADFLEGDSGEDTLEGGVGNDDLFGGLNNDSLNGGPGIDECSGGTGTDTVLLCE
jgi:Ca2+-binding RTX toxin-like protein